MSAPIYLDNNATTKPLPAVVAAMVSCLQDGWANPSSMHPVGQDARRLLAQSRQQVAALLGCQAAELVFTSGATESNHTAVLGALARGRESGRKRLVLSAVEHAGFLSLAARLRSEGTPVDLIPVRPDGTLDLAAAQALMGPDVALVSVMGANNETGIVMPVAELAAMAHAAGTWLHVDATQCIGKLDLRFDASGADLWSVSAHKLHGPKGIGALVLKKGVALSPLLSGKQERNRRGGTENLPGIAGFAAAAQAMAGTLADDLAHMRGLQARLEAGLLAALPGVHIHGRTAQRLPNTTYLRFGALDAEQVLARLEKHGVMASTGAACSAGGTQPSHVLLAMGETPELARGAVRLSLGRDTTADEIDRTVAIATQSLGPPLTQPVAA